MDAVRVLAYGGINDQPCDVFRIGMYLEPLRERSVLIEPWAQIGLIRRPGFTGGPTEGVPGEDVFVDLSPLERCDVLLLRRWQHTRLACATCGRMAASIDDLRRHAETAAHVLLVPDPVIRALVAALERRPESLRHLAVVYETDDYLLGQPEWVGFRASLDAELDLIERMMRLADLVTVSTSRLAALLRRYNANIRVIRNAVDAEWYGTERAVRDDERLDVLFYGATARRNDYEICREAVDELRREAGGEVVRTWLGGGIDARSLGVDVALPYEPDIRTFARRLCEVGPDIGLAPVGRDDFASAKSELHWLEYTMAGAATIATRTLGDGPYSVIRDGVDGLLARNKQEWREQLRRAARSRDLREQLAGRARERVLAEYDARQRVEEWADAFGWAAEHPGAASRAA